MKRWMLRARAWLNDFARAPLLWAFRTFCRAVVRFEYRRCEAHGRESFPLQGPVLLCANHPSALADAVVLQALLPRPLHPLARSGLFRNPLLRPLLALIGAVPVYRRQDDPTHAGRNVDVFERCYELLGAGGVILIFPEGETHADSRMRTFRTGAARIALGALERNGVAPCVLPAGINFSELGRFRGSVLVNVGTPVEVRMEPGESPEAAVLRLTDTIRAAMQQVTLNLDSWQDLHLLRRIERFFVLRRGFARQRKLSQRFRSLQWLADAHRRLRQEHPAQVARVQLLLEQFERLCRRVGVRDYQVDLRYSPMLVGRFLLRSLLTVAVVLPLGLWGVVNSALPGWLTGTLTPRVSRGLYQYDTARIGMSMAIFGAFWGVQTALVYAWLGTGPAALYAAALVPTAAIALYVSRERQRLLDNVRVFILFMRRRQLREFLVERRSHLEYELARLAQLAKREPEGEPAADVGAAGGAA